MTLVELMIVASTLAFSLLVFTQTMTSSIHLGKVNRETRLATDAAYAAIEDLQGSVEFSEVFVRYNADPADDPVPDAPGSNFDVFGLDPVEGDADGSVGEILFPTATDGSGTLVLRESLADATFGLPRDLNLDGDVLDDLVDEYDLLPVLVRVRWQGPSSVRTVEIRTLLGAR